MFTKVCIRFQGFSSETNKSKVTNLLPVLPLHPLLHLQFLAHGQSNENEKLKSTYTPPEITLKSTSTSHLATDRENAPSLRSADHCLTTRVAMASGSTSLRVTQSVDVLVLFLTQIEDSKEEGRAAMRTKPITTLERRTKELILARPTMEPRRIGQLLMFHPVLSV
jgi:hypothetical protein